MVALGTFKQLALSFPHIEVLPHFEKISYRLNKKIFATLSEKDRIVCIKLTEIEQSLFCTFDNTAIYPVNNKWGKQGWTLIVLDKVPEDTLKDALNIAYEHLVTKHKKQ
ncbi:MAG TPA: MmcQ/YjbR family DNA-binding protein [Cytophagales bacterium]|nr:MmcQ/YjbR family DNA-binding protein [Cytophagales bacterium]